MGARGHYWFTSLDGKIKLSKGGTEGTKLDADDDLGMEDEGIPVVEVFIGSGKHHLSLSFANLDYDGDNILDRDINFNGVTFTVGERIETSVDVDTWDIKYQYDLLNLENVLDGFTLGMVARVEILDGETEMKSDTAETDRDFFQPIPYGGVDLHLDILEDLLEARILGTAGYYEGI
jgi:hypothetical protein